MNKRKNKMLNLINKFSYLLEKAIALICVVVMGSLAVVMILNVSFRYFLNLPIMWADEVVLFLFAWVTFLGASIGVQRNNMAAVRMFVDRFSGNLLIWINIIIQLSIIFFGAVLTYYSFKWWTSPSTINTISPSLGVSMWIPTMILPIGMSLILFFGVVNIIRIYNNEEIYLKEN